MEAMKFAWKAVKFVKSNGIIVTNDHQTLGVGPGQTNRVGSVKIALEATADKDALLQENAVLGSDTLILNKKSTKYPCYKRFFFWLLFFRKING